MPIVYKLTSPSAKSYIGYTKHTLEMRFKQHVHAWKAFKRGAITTGCIKLYYAFDKYHPDKWIGEVIFESDSEQECLNAEYHLIYEYDTIDDGYNGIPGGLGGSGKKLSQEHKDNIGKAREQFFKTVEGLAWKEELRLKLAIDNPSKPGKEPWNKGQKCPQISKSLKGKSPELSEEQMEKKSRSMKDAWADGKFDNRKPPTYTIPPKGRLGIPQTEYQKSRAREVKGKVWIVVHPNGDEEEVFSLRNWCIDRGWNSNSGPANLPRTGYKGYRAYLK